MSWDEYIKNLMAKDFVMDAALVGHKAGGESVWASTPGGKLSGITVAEIKVLNGTDRSILFSSGVTLAGNKTTVLRDTLNTEEVWTMDIRTKPSDDDANSYSVCVAKSLQALIIVKAKKDIHGGMVNKAAYEMATYLRGQQY
ncbi:profilin-1 [Clupea harengus]|uniref:Profilin n=1 Tax=Clupea harengus TaxID=7950 RepID=A0A6P3W2C7_CLUHA|nr:profilin-1 [Clupea harengus]